MSSSEPLEKPLLYFMFLFNSLVLICSSVVILFGTGYAINLFLKAFSNSQGVSSGYLTFLMFFFGVVAFLNYIAFLVRKGMYNLKVTREVNLLIVALAKYVFPTAIYFWIASYSLPFGLSIPLEFSFSTDVIVITLFFMLVLDFVFEKISKKPEPEIIY